MTSVDRRTVLIGAAATVAALRLRSFTIGAPAGAADLLDDPFGLGVATGDPTSTGFIAWTRLAPDPTNGGGMAPEPVSVTWTVAADAAMGSVIRTGTVNAVAELAHTVHADVDGLDPDGEYFVQFSAGGWESPVARGRTLPASGAAPLRFGFVSCQSYPVGWYNAYRGLAAEKVDLWLHLGDYIYENGGTGPIRSQGPDEIFTLAQYRDRYGIYKSDPDLMAAHASAPCIPVWDDHEVDNNYADTWGGSGQTPDQILARRTAGYRAWFEHLPVRLSAPTGPDLLIHRRFSWGDLATFHMLDGRQHRDPAPCQAELEASDLPVVDCDERTSADRSMLGADQTAWLRSGVGASNAVWDVVGQQTVFSPMPLFGLYNTDQWDGYPQDRQRVWEILRERPNPVVLTGDIHAAGVARLHHDLDDVSTERIGTELVGTSISSGFIAGDLADAAQGAVAALPYVEYINVHQRGYTVVELTAEEMSFTYKVVEDNQVQGSPISVAHADTVPARSVDDRVPEEPPGDPGEAPGGPTPPAVPIEAPANFTG